jgi:excisionase family DNA binding protein
MTPTTESVPPLPEMATKRQVAAWAQVSPSTIKRMVARNEIQFVRVGRQLRFPGAIIRAAFLKGEPAA